MDNNDTNHKIIHLEPTVNSSIILEFFLAHSYFQKQTCFKLGSKKNKQEAVNSTTNALLKELVSCCFLPHAFGFATTGIMLFDCRNKLADDLHAALYCKCGVEFHDATNSKVPTNAKLVQTFLRNLVNQQANKYHTGNWIGNRNHPGLFDRPARTMSSWPTVHQPTTTTTYFCHALPNHGNDGPLSAHNNAMIPQSISMMPYNMPYASQHMPSSSTNNDYHHHQLQHMHQTNPQSAIANNNNDNNQYYQQYRQHSMQYPAQSTTHQGQMGHGNGCSLAAMTQAESVAVSSSELSSELQVDNGPSSTLQPLPFRGENVEADDNDVAAIVSLIKDFAICNGEEEEETEKKCEFDDMSIDFYADCNSVGRLDSSFRSRRSSGRSTRRSSRRFSSDSLLSDAFTITQETRKEALLDSLMMTYFESAKFEQDCELLEIESEE